MAKDLESATDGGGRMTRWHGRHDELQQAISQALNQAQEVGHCTFQLPSQTQPHNTPMPRTKFIAESERCPGHTHVLLVTTGSVASIKVPLMVKEFLKVSPLGS